MGADQVETIGGEGMRKRSIKRWIRWYKIETCIPPKVRLVCSQRNHGFSVQFGIRYQNYLIKNGLYWTPEGNPTKQQQKHYAGFSGWVNNLEDWKHLWRYIKECHIDGAIHKMDLIQ